MKWLLRNHNYSNSVFLNNKYLLLLYIEYKNFYYEIIFSTIPEKVEANDKSLYDSTKVSVFSIHSINFGSIGTFPVYYCC